VSKAMKAKVTIDKTGRKATIDVKARYKPGTYILHASTKITDVAGNPLSTPTSRSSTSRVETVRLRR